MIIFWISVHSVGNVKDCIRLTRGTFHTQIISFNSSWLKVSARLKHHLVWVQKRSLKVHCKNFVLINFAGLQICWKSVFVRQNNINFIFLRLSNVWRMLHDGSMGTSSEWKILLYVFIYFFGIFFPSLNLCLKFLFIMKY